MPITIPESTNVSQDDAVDFQANQTPDGLSDAPNDYEDPEDKSGHSHHQPHVAKFDYPRRAERERVAPPSRPALRIPGDPKSTNGKQLSPATLNRDRDMLESRKQRG